MKPRRAFVSSAVAIIACFTLASPLVWATGTSVDVEVGKVHAVDEIHIHKQSHRLDLVSQGDITKSYRVAIGPGGAGPKQWQGDAVTPVGRYRIVGRIPGLYHRFLTLSYPNEDDRRRFAELKKAGLVPSGRGIGFGVGIHGTGHAEWNGSHKDQDWTLGCIALDDDEIDEIAAQVKDGTTVVIDD